MQKLKTLVENHVAEISPQFPNLQSEQLSSIVESSVILGILEGQRRTDEVCKNCEETGGKAASWISNEVRRKTTALVANLSAMR